MPWYCFPRRAQVGGAMYLSGNDVIGSGSRSIYAQTNTGFSNGHRSGQRLLIVRMVLDMP